MGDFFTGKNNPIEKLFGENSSGDPRVVLPIVLVAFIILIFIAFRLILADKGKSDMTEEELAKDRELFDDQLRRHAAIRGEEYVPEVARAIEKKDIEEARKRYGKPPPDKGAS